MHSFRSLLLASAGSVFLVTADAGQAPYVDEPMVVTADRDERSLDETLAHVSVIVREDIERSQAPDLLELLRMEAGLDVARAGGPGGQTGVFMRGANSNHTLVLIDGVRVSAAGTGAFAWENLDVATIERIEIVRGPRAARWGSDAIGGVVQIFTRKADGPSLRASYGRYRDRSLQAAWGRQDTATPISVTASTRRVTGFSAQNERGFAFDPDDDGFKNNNLALAGGHDTGSGQLNWSLRGSDGETEFDQGVLDYRKYSGQAGWNQQMRDDWNLEFSTGFSRDLTESTTDFGVNEFNTRRVQTGAISRLELAEGLEWLAGVDAWSESARSDGDFTESRWNIGAWSGIDGHRDRLDYQLSVRWDRDELFGNATTGQAAVGFSPAEDLRLYTSLGRAFRAPNFNQLFSPGFGGQFAGNPDLDPETSLSLELGSNWQITPSNQVNLNLFETRIDDLIDFVGPDFQAVNIDRAEITGAELGWQFNGRHIRSRASYTWQDATDRDTGDDLLRRARDKASVGLDWFTDGGAWIGGEVVHTGSREDVGDETLPSHTLVNLRAGFPVAAGLRLEGRLENLTDRDYDPLYGFNAHGRSLFVAVSWQP